MNWKRCGKIRNLLLWDFKSKIYKQNTGQRSRIVYVTLKTKCSLLSREYHVVLFWLYNNFRLNILESCEIFWESRLAKLFFRRTFLLIYGFSKIFLNSKNIADVHFIIGVCNLVSVMIGSMTFEVFRLVEYKRFFMFPVFLNKLYIFNEVWNLSLSVLKILKVINKNLEILI